MVYTCVSGAYGEIREGSSPFSDIFYARDAEPVPKGVRSGSSASELRAELFCDNDKVTIAKNVDPLNANEQDSPFSDIFSYTLV